MTPTLLDQLRRIVTRHCGTWTTHRAIDALDGLVGRDEARQMLDQLAADGLLARRAADDDLWFLPPTVRGFTPQIARQIRRIPGVASAELGEGDGLIGVHTTDGRHFFVEVRPGHLPDEPADDEQPEDDE